MVMRAVPLRRNEFPPELTMNGNNVTRAILARKVESMWIALRMMYQILWRAMHLI